MAESMRDVAAGVAREEVAKFAREALDYPWPHEQGAVRPRELLEWVIEQRQRQAAMRKYLGAAVLAVLSAGLSVAVPGLWAWLAHYLSR